jgi:multiple sugar transport system permease protein
MTQSRRQLAGKIFTCIVLTLAAAALVFPFIWMLSGAFKDALEAVKMPPSLLPSKFNFDNFAEIKKYFPIDRFLLNSIIVAVTTTFLQLLFCLMAAFVFAKISFKGKNLLFLMILITLMIPEQVIMAPLFIIFSNLSLTDTYLGLILPGTFSAFGIFMLRQHIMTIPDTMIEAAVIDGASYYKVFAKIIFPLTTSTLAALGIFAFMNTWNSFLWPLIVISNKNLMTLPLGLSKLTGRWSTEWNILMAGNVVSFLPIFIVYLFAQKYFIKGITLTGIKG